jgi:hypothetical protein
VGHALYPVLPARGDPGRLLPAAFTCEAGQFTLAGWLEPAAAVGGDTFDYTLERDCLQVSITDAVGHQVAASLLATLLVGSLRNGRRKGLKLGEQARYANDCLAENAPPGQFVTGQLVRVDLHTGTAGIVNAGHTLPLRLRGGAVEEIELRVEAPFGVIPGKAFDVQPFSLEPGDRIVFLTDGMQERNAASLDVAAALADTADLHPREVVHALGAAVLHATGGDLRDDATMVCLDWYGGPPAAGTPNMVPTPTTPRRAPDRPLRSPISAKAAAVPCVGDVYGRRLLVGALGHWELLRGGLAADVRAPPLAGAPGRTRTAGWCRWALERGRRRGRGPR